jgi:hypothetical protein
MWSIPSNRRLFSLCMKLLHIFWEKVGDGHGPESVLWVTFLRPEKSRAMVARLRFEMIDSLQQEAHSSGLQLCK